MSNKFVNLPEYYNEEFRKYLKDCAKQIIKVKDTMIQTHKYHNIAFVKQQYKDYYDENPLEYTMSSLLFDKFNCDWLGEVTVLVTDKPIMKGQIDNEFFVLDNYSFLYKVVFDKNTSDFTFQRTVFEIEVTYAYEHKRPPFVYMNNRKDERKLSYIKSATLVFSMPYFVKSYDIEYILYHELTHLAQRTYFDGEMLSKSMTFFDGMFKNTKTIFDDISNSKTLDELDLPLVVKNNKLIAQFDIVSEIKKNFSPYEVFLFIVKNNYQLNLSEIHSNISNVIRELNEHSYEELQESLYKTNDYILTMYEFSEIFKKFYNIVYVCEQLIYYYPDSKKTIFAQKYIKEVIDQELPQIGLLFNSTHDYKGTYDYRSFDKLFEEFVKMIDMLVENSETCLREIISKNKAEVNENFRRIYNSQFSIPHIWKPQDFYTYYYM